MNIQGGIINLISNLYADRNLSRANIQSIIEKFQTFITDFYNPCLLDTINMSLKNAISDESSKEIKKIFEYSRNCFEKFSSEDKRIRIFQNLNLYSEPEMVMINVTQKISVDDNVVKMQNKEISLLKFDIKKLLIQLLEKPGLFNEIQAYTNYLREEKNILCNFTQGTLWKKLLNNFHDNGIPIPLMIYYDDIEIGNALGSHGGINKLGAIYAKILNVPPSYASKLKNILICGLFLTKYRKMYGILFLKVI